VTHALYAGLMSGTSLDGVDAVLADFSAPRPRILASSHVAFDPALRAELLALNSAGADELERAALAGNALARAYARAVEALDLDAHGGAGAVRAIGCHGQTVRHRPERGYTIQIGNAALLAELTGIAAVADFRSRDVAAGGQGAPLAPAFHAAVFSSAAEDRAVLNLGGIANLTWLPRGGEVGGFDTGPGNCLLDLWAARHLGAPHDAGGAWAAGGNPDPRLLETMLAEPYFAAPPPKSTGRDLFNAGWLEARLQGGEEPRAVQATLLELTAQSVAAAIATHCAGARRVIACGGGVQNDALMRRLAELLIPAALESSEAHGIAPQLVEAAAFAWLAKQAIEARAASLPAVTGARGARVLGAIYPK
jgi:anhydro-N-acetylmuramic acid kinase